MRTPMVANTATFRVNGRLDGLNEYTRACRSNKYAGAKLKKRNQAKVVRAIEDAGLKPLRGNVSLVITWYDKPGANGRHRDKDNIAFAKKFVLDGMVEAGLIADDDWATVIGFTDLFVESDDEGVGVFAAEVS